MFLLLLLGVLVPAFAEPSAPAWIQQLKLSGLSGLPTQRLAIINNETFATGEANVVKVAGRQVQVQCLEIREQSVLVQIEGLSDPYELTMSGEVISQATGPTVPFSQPAIVQVQSPAPVPIPSDVVYSPPPTGLVMPSVNKMRVISPAPGHSWRNLFLLMLLAIAFVARAFARGNVSPGIFAPLPVPQQKNLGEAMVAQVISSQFNRPHLLLNNITLPTADGTTQIDHVLVADTGIFVIETKHYSGWIFGNPKDSQWTQMINRKKYRFQNPLRQNYGHVKALEFLFDLPSDYFHSVVVFTGEARFKTDLGPDVVYLSGLIPMLAADRPLVLDESRRICVKDRIESERAPRSVETDELHVNHVRNKIAAKTRSRTTTVSCRLPAVNTQSFNVNATADLHARYMPKT